LADLRASVKRLHCTSKTGYTYRTHTSAKRCGNTSTSSKTAINQCHLATVNLTRPPIEKKKKELLASRLTCMASFASHKNTDRLLKE